MAKLYFKYGAMNCGKTTILLQTAHNYEERGMKIIVVKPSKDLKAGDNIQSRLGAERKVDYLVKPDESILEIAKDNLDVDCIFVDEVQFLEPKQIDELLKITIIYDIPVICYGLRTDFKTNGFPASTRLLEIAHKIEEIKTMCRCGAKAIFNARFVNGKLTNEGDQVAIDGFDNVTYESMCPKCYYEALNGKVKKLTK
ncbi:MAG: thymidine kinase [Bacilli bacterium]|nr:thymidine kinase [Bacilli bacterium]